MLTRLSDDSIVKNWEGTDVRVAMLTRSSDDVKFKDKQEQGHSVVSRIAVSGRWLGREVGKVVIV